MEPGKTVLRRLERIHRLISDNKYPNKAFLASDLEVSQKTIQRDIAYLKDEYDAPIEVDKTKNGFSYTEEFFFSPNLSISESELVALTVGSKAMAAYQGINISEKMDETFEKLCKFLPESTANNSIDLFYKFHFSTPPGLKIDPEIWKTVVQALVSEQQVEITYNHKTYPIHPLYIANLQGEWYLFARAYDYDDFRQYSIGRIKQATLLDKKVDRKGFNPRNYTDGVLYRFASEKEPFSVIVHFDSCIAESLKERDWHPDQIVRELEDGKVELEFTAKGDIEVKRWILAWGKHCQVISPAWLKTMIHSEIKDMYRLMSDKG